MPIGRISSGPRKQRGGDLGLRVGLAGGEGFAGSLDGLRRILRGLSAELRSLAAATGWRLERAPSNPDEAASKIAPDWVCEVLSPSTRAWDREKKMPFYAFHRVGHLWMVDPVACELEVFALGRRGWELLGTFGGDAKVRAEPFEEMELALRSIWPLSSSENSRQD